MSGNSLSVEKIGDFSKSFEQIFYRLETRHGCGMDAGNREPFRVYLVSKLFGSIFFLKMHDHLPCDGHEGLKKFTKIVFISVVYFVSLKCCFNVIQVTLASSNHYITIL